MCLYSKQFLNSKPHKGTHFSEQAAYFAHQATGLVLRGALWLCVILGLSTLSYAQSTSDFTLDKAFKDTVIIEQSGGNTAGGLAPGESRGGVIDTLYVTAPPNWSYVVEKQAGSFVDCGNGTDFRATDKNGRDSAALACGVTITETLVIPAASQSARLIVHY